MQYDCHTWNRTCLLQSHAITEGNPRLDLLHHDVISQNQGPKQLQSKAYIFKADSEFLHDIHNNTCGGSRSAHCTVHKHHILIGSFFIEEFQLLIYLISHLVQPTRLARVRLLLPRRLESHLKSICPCGCLFKEFLSLAYRHFSLEYIVDQRIWLVWVLIEILVVRVCTINELKSQWKCHLDLDVVNVFDVNPQILNF